MAGVESYSQVLPGCMAFRPLEFRHDMFFGDLRWSRALDGITLSHRIANAPPEAVETHTHLEAHFVLVTAGRYVSSARGTANPRSMLIYNPPGTTHRDHFIDGKGAFFSISLSNPRLASATTAVTRSVALHLESNPARGLAVALLMECARWKATAALTVESLCLELLEALTDARPPFAKCSPPRWLHTAYELICDCPEKTPDVRYLASAVGVHPTHLARAFRTFLGCTPGDLLRARRLELATARLMDSSRDLAEVSLDSGFSDQAQFTKAFRRLYGLPPGRYRRLIGARLPSDRLHFDKTVVHRTRQAGSRRS